MPEETLITAARRAVRFFTIDMNKGGLITVDTEQAMDTLDKQVGLAIEEEKRKKGADIGGRDGLR